jgi:hypothetical protein
MPLASRCQEARLRLRPVDLRNTSIAYTSTAPGDGRQVRATSTRGSVYAVLTMPALEP